MKLSERLYRVALRVYPACYRAAREDEILATLGEGQGSAFFPEPASSRRSFAPAWPSGTAPTWRKAGDGFGEVSAGRPSRSPA